MRTVYQQAIARKKSACAKPEKGTKPKLFYVGVDGDLLNPTMMEPQASALLVGQIARRRSLCFKKRRSERAIPGAAREVYDVPHATPWGKKIASYLWTKSISAGVLLLSALFLNMGFEQDAVLLNVISPALSLLFLAATMILLVLDLKKPGRFFFLLTKPNLDSWLVLGGYVLMIFGFLLSGLAIPDLHAGMEYRLGLFGPRHLRRLRLPAIRPFFSPRRAAAIFGKARCYFGICSSRPCSRAQRC